jgi:hypothetical protein
MAKTKKAKGRPKKASLPRWLLEPPGEGELTMISAGKSKAKVRAAIESLIRELHAKPGVDAAAQAKCKPICLRFSDDPCYQLVVCRICPSNCDSLI